MVKHKREDWIDKMVAWGCKLVHLDKYTATFQQLAKFVIVGVINTAINWTIFALALHILPIPDEVTKSVVASAIAFILATIFNFWASITWVFDTTNKKSRRRLFVEFAVMTGVAFLIFDEAMLAWLVAINWAPMLAKIVTTACGMVFNFITRKMFLEDHSKHPQTSAKSRRGKSTSR